MGSFEKCLIVSDLDGTLFDSKTQVNETNRRAIDYFCKNGGYFTTATGRSYQDGVRYCDVQNVPVIFYNGGLIYDFRTDSDVHTIFLKGDVSKLISTVLGLSPLVSVEAFMRRSYQVFRRNGYTPRHLAWMPKPPPVSEPGQAEENCIYVASTGSSEQLDIVQKGLLQYFGDMYRVIRTGPELIEIVPPESGKRAAVNRLADMLGVPRSRIYTVGDGQNDLDMLRGAAISFAPLNAASLIKHEVATVLPSHNDGCIKYLIDYLEMTGV